MDGKMAGYQHGSALQERIRDNLAQFQRSEADGAALRRAAVVLAIVAADDGEAAFVLTRRAPRLKAHSGQWALPGGRLDEGETFAQAALRELSEEVGLHLPAENILGVLDDYPTRSGYLITPIVAWAAPDAEMTINEREVEKLYRIKLSELDREDSPQFESIPESDRPLIRLLIMEHHIHAPTAAVIHQFGEVAVHGRETRVAHYEQPVFAWR
jgi:8-oxo-dGTP pyrophosphatase MutT (NUDIX family)